MLEREAIVVESGPAADQRIEPGTGELVRDQRRRRRIRDPHLAERGGVRCNIHAKLVTGAQRRDALLPGHRGLDRKVSRTGRDPSRYQPRSIDRVAGDPCIDDLQIHVVRPREYVRGGAAGEKVRDHLARPLPADRQRRPRAQSRGRPQRG